MEGWHRRLASQR
jgi:hypothetical protein